MAGGRKAVVGIQVSLFPLFWLTPMTRHRLNRTLRWAVAILGFVLAITLAAKLAPHVPLVAKTPIEAIARDVYDYAKDMALVFITLVAVYLANAFQRRATFVANLERQWRDIVHAKALLVTYFDKPYPTAEDWLAASATLSEAIDTMRTVYRNAGETATLVGVYPYAALHDMRRVLEAADPRVRNSIPMAERKLSRDSIAQSFNALRETFLDELDLEEPHYPLLIAGARRTKSPGSAATAKTQQMRMREALARTVSPAPEVDAYLGRLYARELTSGSGDPSGADTENGNAKTGTATGTGPAGPSDQPAANARQVNGGRPQSPQATAAESRALRPGQKA